MAQGIVNNGYHIHDERYYTESEIDTKVSELNSSINNEANARQTADTELQNKINLLSNYVTPQMFGAKGDGETDDGDALRQLFASGKIIRIPKGTYLVKNGNININANCSIIEGDGSRNTVIKFEDSSIISGFYRHNVISTNLHITGIRIDGVDKNLGTNRHGFWSEVDDDFEGGREQSYGLRMIDVATTRWSGDGFHVTDWFQQYWQGCYARNIGGDGFVICGDQFPTFINSQDFNLDIDGASWWFQGGSPFLQGLNCGVVGIGLKLGRPASHRRGASFCNAQVMSCNIEELIPGGIGVYVHNGSTLNLFGDLNIYAPSKTDITTVKGIYFEYINTMNIFIILPSFIRVIQNACDFEYKIYIDGASENGTLLTYGKFSDGVITGINQATINKNIQFGTNNSGDLSLPNVEITKKFKDFGQHYVDTRTVTSSTNITRDNEMDDQIILADATDNAIYINFDYASYLNKRRFTVKKIDKTENGVFVQSNSKIDGQDIIKLTADNDKITILSNGSTWYSI